MGGILIVDDEAQVREVLRRYVANTAEKIREAESSAEALALLEDEVADVVLCDVQMPGERDGIWLANEIRRRYPACAVVLITSDQFVPGATSLKAGVVAYIVKPFTSAQVLDALRTAVDWRASGSSAPDATHDSANRVDAWLDESE